jgi:4,5-dihydroxyphthalate decarboxylase
VANLKLTFACQNYDRVRALIEGRVALAGIDLNYLDLPPWFTFPRMVGGREFEASELGITIYTATLGLKDPPFIAIPVFLSRTFRRSAIYVNANSGIETPKDLIGKRVGEAFLYGHDGALWPRGILQDDYGVPPQSCSYFLGGVDKPAAPWDWLPYRPPPFMRVEHVGAERSLDAMLEAGEIDALYSAITPPSILRGSPRVRRLFEDAEAEERAAFKRTGVFPIMHLVVLRRDFYEQNRWVARALYDALRKAKDEVTDLYYNNFGGRLHLLIMIPLLTELVERNRRMMGDDPWPYGVEPNRKTLEAFLRYHHEQGLSPRRLVPEELFAPETLVD